MGAHLSRKFLDKLGYWCIKTGLLMTPLANRLGFSIAACRPCPYSASVSIAKRQQIMIFHGKKLEDFVNKNSVNDSYKLYTVILCQTVGPLTTGKGDSNFRIRIHGLLYKANLCLNSGCNLAKWRKPNDVTLNKFSDRWLTVTLTLTRIKQAVIKYFTLTKYRHWLVHNV